ncbi:MAG TPA: ABC transporter ATP-binding protein [Spirochaetia bacterium]|nr:ABC transporter ATP-binding protein [Spirochaetales bacterium]HRS65303.1 ABC transporter ATP-binding protein [Spirochaetia bacterium]HOT58635.1 ABC transporter ATP-binding protein [Spirochaetales bacterium]HPD80924.1 ABC transporter ATP-binding protein [Spirochaetales bacterium]HQG40687.1 ABC transporter ATP-binding protein [Spirochaetales bacterium]
MKLFKENIPDAKCKKVLFSLRDVSKSFSDGTVALSKISFDIYEREILVITGPNGSGKSVLLKLLVNLLEPTTGTLLYKEKTVKSWSSAINREVGFVFQDADVQILGDTVEDDVSFGPENVGIKGNELSNTVTHALTTVGLLHKRTCRPAVLSGGEKRRLAIASVLAMGVKTIIMDEPYANLDWEGVRLVNDTIRSLEKIGYTFIIVSHELEKIAGLAHRIGILYKGMLKTIEKPEVVFSEPFEQWGVRDPRMQYHSFEDCVW